MREAFVGARRARNLPTVLTQEEARMVLAEMQGVIGICTRNGGQRVKVAILSNRRHR
jgi:hypothetical protein